MSYTEIVPSETRPEPFSISESAKNSAILTASEGVILLPSIAENNHDISSRRDYGIWDEGRATLVGTITMYSWGKDLVDIGYDVEPIHQRRGYASLALRAIADYARDSCNVRTQATIGFSNIASQGTAQRAGFEITEVLPGGTMIFTDQAGL